MATSALDYIFSTGVTDAYCDRPDLVPSWERGMFAYNLTNNPAAVTDGLSNTFAMGEGAQGTKYRLCFDVRLKMTDVNNYSQQIEQPKWVWISGESNFKTAQTAATPFRCTPAGRSASRSIR